MTILQSPIQFPKNPSVGANSLLIKKIMMRHYYNNSTGEDGIPITLDKKYNFFYITPDPGSNILYTPAAGQGDSNIQIAYELKYIALLPNGVNKTDPSDVYGHRTSTDTSEDYIEVVLMHQSQDMKKSLYVVIRIKSNVGSIPTGLDVVFQPFVKDITTMKQGTSNLAYIPPNWNPFMIIASIGSTDQSGFWNYTGTSISSETDNVEWIVYQNTITISSTMFSTIKNKLPSMNDKYKTNTEYNTNGTPPKCIYSASMLCGINYCLNSIPSNKINYGEKITCFTPEQLSKYCQCWSSNKGYTSGFSYKVVLVALFVVFLILIFILYFKAISGGIHKMRTYGANAIHVE